MDRNEQTKEIRNAASRLLKTEDSTHSGLDSARDELRDLIEDAEKHGFSAAEVVKAVLEPVYAPQPKGCDCFSCKQRREGELDLDSYTNEPVEMASE